LDRGRSEVLFLGEGAGNRFVKCEVVKGGQ
jgi:hypothetical protein